MRLHRLSRVQIHRRQRIVQRSNRLDDEPGHQRRPAGHTPLSAAGPVRLAPPGPVGIGHRLNDILKLGTPSLRQLPARANADRLHRVNAHQSLGDFGVNLAIPVDMRAQANGNIFSNDFHRPAHGVAGGAGGVHFRHHLDRGRLISAVDGGFLHRLPVNGVMRRRVGFHPPNRNDMAVQFDAELLQQTHRHGPRRYPAGGFPGRCPLQRITHIVKAVLHRAGQVRMAGTNARNPAAAPLLRRILHILHRHCILPVDPVSVFQQHPNGAAQRVAMPDAGLNVGMVPLNLLPPAPPVAPLPAPQVVSNVFLIQRQVRRHPLYNYHQPLPMGFACGEPPYHRGRASCAIVSSRTAAPPSPPGLPPSSRTPAPGVPAKAQMTPPPDKPASQCRPK